MATKALPLVDDPNLNLASCAPKVVAPTQMDQTAQKAHALVQKILKDDTKLFTADERAAIRAKMGFEHTSSAGFKHRHSGPMQEAAQRLVELTIDMKNAICGKEPVENFTISLTKQICSYTKNKKPYVKDLKSSSLPPEMKELAELYFKAAETFATLRHKLDAAGHSTTGRQKPTLTKALVQAEAPYIQTKQQGFARIIQLVSHYALITGDRRFRREIADRYAFCDLMHKQLNQYLKQAIQTKEDALKKAGSAEIKKQLNAQLSYLKAIKAELEGLDYFAICVAIGKFPSTGNYINMRGVTQTEVLLKQEIEQCKKSLDEELRDKDSYHLADEDEKEKNKEKFTYADRYIKENCLGLFNLTYATQQDHAHKHGLSTPKFTLEHLFVKEAICFKRPEYAKEGFKAYLGRTLPKGDEPFKQEIEQCVDKLVDDISAAATSVAIPDFEAIASVANSSPKKPSQAYLDGRKQMTGLIAGYTAEIAAKLSSI